MKNLINLTNIYFKEMMVSILGKSKTKRNTSAFVLILLFVLLSASMGYYFYMMADIMNMIGMAESIIVTGLMTSAMINIMTGVKSSQGVFYKSKDYESLAALPIKNSVIIAAKYISSTLTSIIYTLVIVLPLYVVYFIFCGFNAFVLVMCMLSVFFLPAFSQLLGCLLAWFVSAISSRLKNKNIISSILSVVFALVIVVFVYIANSDSAVQLMAIDCPLWVKIVFPYIYFLQKAIIEINFLYYLAFIGVSVFYMMLSLGLVVFGYRNINTKLNETKKSKNRKLTFKKHSPFVAMLKKDASKFVLTPAYLMNVIIGPILTIAIPILMWNIYRELPYLPLMDSIFVIMGAFTIPMMGGIAPASAVSISIEGTSFKIVKSLPVNHKSYLWSKILFNILLQLPFVIIGSVLYAILLKMNIISAVLTLCICLVFIYFSSLTSLFINLKYPKLEWTTATQVVKQSKSVLLSMLIDMVVLVVPMVLGFVLLNQSLNVNLFLLISLLVYMLISVALTILFVKKSEKMYYEIH